MSNNLEQIERETENTKYEYNENNKRMDFNFVDLLKYQHDNIKHIEETHVNLPEDASTYRDGHRDRRDPRGQLV